MGLARLLFEKHQQPLRTDSIELHKLRLKKQQEDKTTGGDENPLNQAPDVDLCVGAVEVTEISTTLKADNRQTTFGEPSVLHFDEVQKLATATPEKQRRVEESLDSLVLTRGRVPYRNSHDEQRPHSPKEDRHRGFKRNLSLKERIARLNIFEHFGGTAGPKRSSFPGELDVSSKPDCPAKAAGETLARRSHEP